MPKLKNLLIAVAAAMLSTSAALTDTKADDRSYLPPQDLRRKRRSPVYRLRRKPSPAFATRIMERRLATRAAITLGRTLAAISSLAFSLACSVSLCGLWRSGQPCAQLSWRVRARLFEPVAPSMDLIALGECWRPGRLAQHRAEWSCPMCRRNRRRCRPGRIGS